jgi:phospholipase/carboxylesterase
VKQVSLVAALLTLALTLGCGRSRAQADPPLTFVERVLGADADAALPLLIAVHGLGDTPERFLELFNQLSVPVRIVAPRAPDPFHEGSSWFPIDDPERAPGAIIRRAELLVRLADRLKRTRKVRGLPVLTGFSQGGILSFAVAAYHPEHFAAAFPLAGSLLDSLPPYHRAPKTFRVVAFHGQADQRIPYQGAERTVQRLQKAGTRASLTGFAGVGHAIPPALSERWFAALREQLARAR